MPQELRWPQFRTGNYSFAAFRVLKIHQYVNAFGDSSLQYAMDVVWPERSRQESVLCMDILLSVREFFIKKQEEKKADHNVN